MNRLDRMVLGEIVGWFVGSILLFSSLILASGELVRLAEFLQNGEAVLTVLQLLGYTLPQTFSLTFPIAMLLATLMGIGRLSSDSELVALISAGISFERIMVPIAIFGLLVSLIGAWFSNTIVPASSAARNRIIDRVKDNVSVNSTGALTRRIPLGDDRDKNNAVLIVHSEGGVSLNQSSAGTATMRDLTLQRWEKNQLRSVIYASQADWKINSRNWTLAGEIYGFEFRPEGGGIFINASSLSTREYALGEPDRLTALKVMRNEDISTTVLRQRSQLFREDGDTRSSREAEVEVARRIALPFASLVFALVGAPLGVRPPRTGKGNGFAIAIIITFLYWTLLQFFTTLGQGGILPPVISVMIPNILGLLAGIFLIRKVSRS